MAGTAQHFIPALRFDALTRLYDPVVAITSREHGFKRRLIEHARIKDGESVLDLGCGTGTLAIEVKKERPKAKVSGIDADRLILERAKEKAKDAGVKISFQQGLPTSCPTTRAASTSSSRRCSSTT